MRLLLLCYYIYFKKISYLVLPLFALVYIDLNHVKVTLNESVYHSLFLWKSYPEKKTRKSAIDYL